MTAASWTGREFVVIAVRKLHINKGIAETFALRGDRWTRLPDLPQPRHGQVIEAATATIDGAVYALAGVGTWHLDPNDMYEAEYSELLRLTRSSWRRVPLPSDVPQSQQALLRVQGSLVALSSACPSTICTQEDGAAALMSLGARARVIPLRPTAGYPILATSPSAGAPSPLSTSKASATLPARNTDARPEGLPSTTSPRAGG